MKPREEVKGGKLFCFCVSVCAQTRQEREGNGRTTSLSLRYDDGESGKLIGWNFGRAFYFVYRVKPKSRALNFANLKTLRTVSTNREEEYTAGETSIRFSVHGRALATVVCWRFGSSVLQVRVRGVRGCVREDGGHVVRCFLTGFVCRWWRRLLASPAPYPCNANPNPS